MGVSTPIGTPLSYADNITNSINAMDYLKNQVLTEAQQKLQEDIAVMESLPTMTAYVFSVAVMGQTAQVIAISQVGVAAEELNIQNATLEMITYIQSLWTDLSGNTQDYQDPTSTDQQNASDLYNSLRLLDGLCYASLDPDSAYYGWLEPSTANTMIDSINTILNSITQNGTDPLEISNTILGWYGSYYGDPSESDSATEINDCTNALDTMENTMSQSSSTTTGLLQIAISRLEEIIGSIESSAQAQRQAAEYYVKKETDT